MKLRSIQAARGIAACAVTLMHSVASHGVSDPGRYAIGAAGVDLFFVISGFIIATVIPGRTAKQFVLDRFRRIYPIWWVAVIPWLFINQFDWKLLATSITLWPIFGDFTLPANDIGWTLSFEVLFYVAIALAIVTRPIVPIFIFTACFMLSPFTSSPLIGYFGNPIILEFLIGVGIARLPRQQWIGCVCIAAAILLLAWSPQHLYQNATAIDAAVSIIRVAYWGVPAAMIVYGVLTLERYFGRWSQPFVMLGNASYSIYLFHLIPILFIPGPWPFRFAAAVSFGVMMWWFIERRLLRLFYHSALSDPVGLPRSTPAS